MFLKALPEKAGISFVPVPTGVCSPFFSGLLGAGLHNPSSVYSSDFPMDRDVLFQCGGSVLQDFCRSSSTAGPLGTVPEMNGNVT